MTDEKFVDLVDAKRAVRSLLYYIGEDPDRDGLRDTPGRVAKALIEMTSGHEADVAGMLAVQFDQTADELISVTGVRFSSMCEHHLLPFTGTATVGYIPSNGKVVGLSKLARLVDAHARRLQVQERMTRDIGDDLERHLSPLGVGVILRAHHSCMGCRGARQPDAEMVTSVTRGVLRDSAPARAEFLALG